MPLEVGCELGFYRILAPLGAGGMGKVFRARDTRLGRDVAIKILPDELAADPERRHRFELEAKLVSRLNHPNICTLYDVGIQGRLYYLVMECIEGTTLQNRLERGALPLDQVLKYGVQIAEALGLAHRNGVIHRDVKPGNIMLTSGGAKLLDFGVAKPEAKAADDTAITQSEDVTTTTRRGEVLGTYPYMSPEQVEGKKLDGRSDLFSLGAVLYEMVTGKRAFQGRTQLSVISAILEKEPEPIAQWKPLTPESLDHAIRRCLAKDPEERWQTGRDLAEELKWIQSGLLEAKVRVSTGARRSVRWSVAAILLALLVLGSLATYWFVRPQGRGRVMSAILSPRNSKGFQFSGEGFGAAVLSPDGRTVAFTAAGEDGKRRLWIRALSGTTSQELTGTEDASYPFWSPDSNNLGFFAEGKLKKTAITGGAPQMLCSAGQGRGGTWNAKGVIVFSPDVNSSLFSVSDTGGTPSAVTKLTGEESDHDWPGFLPDGEHFLFGVHIPGRQPYGRVWVGSLRDGSRKPLLDADWNAVFAAPGYVLFEANDMLMARHIDLRRLEFSGPAVPVGESADTNSSIGQMILAASNTGDLLYRSAGRRATLEWHDVSGNSLGELADAGSFFAPRISPNGKLLAVSQSVAGKSDVYLLDLSRGGARTRFTFGAGDNMRPVWYPDGKKIAFSSKASGRNQMFSKDTSGMVNEEALLHDDYDDSPSSISPDGRFLAYMRRGGASEKLEMWVLPLRQNGQPAPFQPLPVSNKGEPMFSPDGRWLAYSSDESGRREVYIAPFPSTGEKWRVSTDGGQSPAWAPDGKQLFFLPMRADAMMSVAIRLGSPPEVGIPRKLFSVPTNVAPPGVNFSVSPDGRRLLIMTLPQNPEDLPLTLVQNWTAGLK